MNDLFDLEDSDTTKKMRVPPIGSFPQEAGAAAGEAAGADAGQAEALKHNFLTISPEEVEALKAKLSECGAIAGKDKGEAAGTEAGSKINIPQILQEAVAAATKAAEQVSPNIDQNLKINSEINGRLRSTRSSAK